MLSRFYHSTPIRYLSAKLWSTGADVGKQELKELLVKTTTTTTTTSTPPPPPPTTTTTTITSASTAAAPTPIKLLDVRTREENQAGKIPTSLNIPVDEITEALQMKPDEFHLKYGFQKPNKNECIIVYCKAGVRAQKAMDIAKQLGYSNVRNYRGSWLDWTNPI